MDDYTVLSLMVILGSCDSCHVLYTLYNASRGRALGQAEAGVLGVDSGSKGNLGSSPSPTPFIRSR